MQKTDNKDALQIAKRAVERSVLSRLRYIAFGLSLAHLSFGFASFGFLNRLDSSITLFDNFVPRIFLSVLPFFLIGQFLLKNERWAAHRRIVFYIWSYSVLFFVAAWIHVWPLALSGKSEVFLYVAGVNTAYICSTWSVAALPRKYLVHVLMSMLAFIVLPVNVICFLAGDIQVLQVVVGDTLFAMAVGVGLGLVGSSLYWQLELLKAENEVETGKFLGEPLRRAIFEKKGKILEESSCTAYVFMLDIRDSTNLTRLYGTKWSDFNKEWLGFANDTLKAYGGTFVKSTGDGLLAAFGLFDDEDKVRDIPGAEAANKIADEERWLGLTVDTFGCIEVLFRKFESLSASYFPDRAIRLACGLDRGQVFRGIRGGHSRKEFDIWGDKVNTASKLEAFSKSISSKFEETSSLLVISPYGADFLDALDGFKKVDVNSELSGSLQGIRWVLVREYKSEIQTKTKAA